MVDEVKVQQEPTEPARPEPLRQPTLREVMQSVLSAGLGVQSSENRERDFSRGNPLTFIIVGLVFTGLFILVLVGVVWLVL